MKKYDYYTIIIFTVVLLTAFTVITIQVTDMYRTYAVQGLEQCKVVTNGFTDTIWVHNCKDYLKQEENHD